MRNRFQALALVVGLCVLQAAPFAAQTREETLADVRQEMSVLYVETQRLKRELSTTGPAQTGLAGGSALQRIDAIEQELQRLTAKAEELEHRINRIVADGTNRIGDLEFRLCELETNCDVGKLGETTTLGGADQAIAPPVSAPAPGAGGAELAMGEQVDFDRAKAAFESGDNQGAAELFAAFTQAYPGGPLSGEAHFMRGDALRNLGRTADAARAYLESFSGAPDGPHAPDALYKLGLALNDLGQTQEACVTLGEVGARFPMSSVTADANAALQRIGCN